MSTHVTEKPGTQALEQMTNGHGDAPKSFGETLLDLFAVIARWRRFLVRFVLAITLVTIVVALLLPKWYKATAKVFPAERADLFSGLEGISSLVKTFGGGGGRLASLGQPSEAERYMAILKSETALLQVIEKFDLTRVYEITSYPREKTMRELLSNVQVNLSDEGALEIDVYDTDPERAASMANYFVEVLNDINSQLNAQNAKGNRAFIEQRYNKNMEDIGRAEEALKSFQLKYGVVAVPQQTEASIKALAELDAQLAAKEIELSVLRRTFSESHPSVQAAAMAVEETQKKLRSMNSGEVTLSDDMKALIPFRKVPQLAVDYMRLFREQEIQYKILQFITPLYEQAKVEEQRSTPSVVVLDHASVPERKAKPKVSLFALLAFVVSTLIGMMIVFVLEGAHRLQALYPERWGALTAAVTSDWFGLRFKRRRE